jgi:hypothetical protein
MNPFNLIAEQVGLNADSQGPDAALHALLQVSATLYDANTTLASNINNSVTSVPVVNGAHLPAADFPILIGSEKMYVSSRSGNTLTVTRGYGGTSAASHTAADVVSRPDTYTGRTPEALLRLRDINPHFLAMATAKLNSFAEKESR